MQVALICSLIAAISAVHAQPVIEFEQVPSLAPLAPPLSWTDHLSTPGQPAPALPVEDTPFNEHVRVPIDDVDAAARLLPEPAVVPGVPVAATTPAVEHGGRHWVGTAVGLYSARTGQGPHDHHPHYGNAHGPASSHISGLAADSRGTLWVATAAGLSSRDADGNWQTYRGRQGLPVEELTCLAIDADDCLWLGSSKGLIHFRPGDEPRQWFYRQGPRYLLGDYVEAVAVGPDGIVRVRTNAGWNGIETVERTLHGKATHMLERYVERHRRLGMPSPAVYEDPEKTGSWTHGPQPSDGLWTSYHITSMAMAYTLTGEEKYKELAREGMEALYLLQNVTGYPGVVARSVLAIDEPSVPQLRTQDNWHETEDGKYLWRDDVSSDQITGHYLAFYTYYEHIAKHDPAERDRLEKQLRQVTDFIVDNNFQILDWHGEMTMWGWFNPELVNDDHDRYLESGLYSLMILSFLRTAHHITGDRKYLDHFKTFVTDHDYVSNIFLQKKVFPDELNHSDDQLSACVFYPFMQMEHTPFIRDALHRALRRHARIERDERNSLIGLVYAAVDPEDADIEGSLRTLREMPLDRRDWRQENSHRADVVLQREKNVGSQAILLEALPADERQFERWNADPYVADSGGRGTSDGDGVQWMLTYWLARYHGILAGPQ